MRGQYVSGPACRTCGMFAVNVVHDDAEARRRNIATWAAPSPAMNGQDYYTWAGIRYHPFLPDLAGIAKPKSKSKGDEYRRGYAAGYKAKRRAEAR